MNPFRQTYQLLVSPRFQLKGRDFDAVQRVQQRRHAHENPVLFYSCVIGAIGPVLVVTVPPIRRKLGWKPIPEIPTSYPSLSLALVLCSQIERLFHLQVPNRPRVPLQGYEDP
jgi:hypothetical protein